MDEGGIERRKRGEGGEWREGDQGGAELEDRKEGVSR